PFNEFLSWIRILPLDDLADLLQLLPDELRGQALAKLDEKTRSEVKGLLDYAEDDAGGVMNPHYIRLRPEMSVDEAIRYMRALAKTQLETLYYAYVLDRE